MTKNTKIFLGVGCGVLLIVGIAVVIGGILAVNHWGKRFAETTARAEEEGTEFGKTTDQQGCVDEGVQRSKKAALIDFSSGIGLSAFVGSCLKVSRPTEDFCDGVPAFGSMQDTEWSMSECREVGVNPEETACIYVMKSKHEFCSKPSL